MPRRRFQVAWEDMPLPKATEIIVGAPSGEGVASLTSCKQQVIWRLRNRISDLHALIAAVDRLRVSDIPRGFQGERRD